MTKWKLDGEGPLFKQFQRTIIQQIVEGEFAPGDRLPSEAELMQHYALSRQTISKALSELADQGLLERNKRAGTTVAKGFRERFLMPIKDISVEVGERGGVYEYRILTLKKARNGDSGLRWNDLPLGAPLLHIEVLHLADNTVAQHERRFINLTAVPKAVDQTFEREPPGMWLMRNALWTWVRRRITAVNATEEVSRLLQVPVGAACVTLERRLYHQEDAVSIVFFIHPGDRFALDGDFGLAVSEHPLETTGRPHIA
jgi:GntR family histidine utilization transcriptional repressor